MWRRYEGCTILALVALQDYFDRGDAPIKEPECFAHDVNLLRERHAEHLRSGECDVSPVCMRPVSRSPCEMDGEADAPGTIHLSAPTSSARNTIFDPLRDSSTAAPRVTISLTASLSLRLILVRTIGLRTTRELNAITCTGMSTLRCSGRLGSSGYGRGL